MCGPNRFNQLAFNDVNNDFLKIPIPKKPGIYEIYNKDNIDLELKVKSFSESNWWENNNNSDKSSFYFKKY